MKIMKRVFIILMIFVSLLILGLLGGYHYIKTHYKPYEIDAMMPLVRIDETQNTKSFYFDNGKVHRYVMKQNNDYELIQDSQVAFTEPKKIAVLYVATGRYIKFWDNFYQVTERNFLPRHKKTYFLFTDHDELEVPDNVVKIHVEHEMWPYVVMKRYQMFMLVKDQLKEFDYMYFLNSNLIVMRPVNEEVFPSKEQGFMVTLHSTYWLSNNNSYPYDRNQNSTSGVLKEEGSFYIQSAFNGFRRDSFLKIFSDLENMLNEDLKNGVIPWWHDESALNKYVVEYMKQNKKPLVLLPDYLVPQSYTGNVSELLSQTKILILDKDSWGGHNWFRDVDE